MNKQKILLVIVVLVIATAGWLFFKNKNGSITASPSPTLTPSISPQATVSPSPVETQNIITYTDSGYTPSTITIKKGEAVVWKNESSNMMWTASAMHPLHKVYPGTDISACGTQTLMPMFDSCVGVPSGQSWSFTFNNVGTWGYHNHLNASKFGKVIVE